MTRRDLRRPLEGGDLPYIDAHRRGVPLNDASDSSPAINAIVGSTTGPVEIRFRPGVSIKLSQRVSLRSGVSLNFTGVKVSVDSAVANSAIYATGSANVGIVGGEIEGAGTAPVSSLEHLLEFVNCTGVRIRNVSATKSRQDGIRLQGCSGVTIDDTTCGSNYAMGVQARDCSDIRLLRCALNQNGNTGVATFSGGRGLVFWRSKDSYVESCKAIGNSEYGFRVYSSTGEATGSSGITFVLCDAGDNVVMDYHVYNESGLVSDITFSDCNVSRSTDPTSNAVVLQGARVNWSGGRIQKSGTRLSVPAMFLYGVSNSRVTGVTGVNLGTAIGMSPSSLCSGIEIRDGSWDCSKLVSTYGTDISIAGVTIRHGGVGASDIGIEGLAAGTRIVGNTIDGFWRAITASTTATIANNRCLNTTGLSIRWYGTAINQLVMYGNELDANTDPPIISALERKAGFACRASVRGSAAPSTLSWIVGDRCDNNASTVGQPKSWVCTAAGTPGTWVSEGNL